VQQGQQELKAQQGRQERKEMLAQLALLDHKAFKESKAIQVPQDQSVQLDLLVLQAQLVLQDLAVLLALKVPQDLLEQQDQ
jgi:hypothetical protein